MTGDVRTGIGRPGAPTFGTWVKLPGLETLELIAHAGFDFVVVDLEHSPLDFETAYRHLVVAQGLGMAAFVRVPDRSGNAVQRVLDAGADGILVPQVTSVEEAREVIAQMTFAPTGVRGMGITSRAGRWGLLGKDYVASGDRVVKAVQLEDRATLERAEEILDLPGLSAAFIGLGDLSMSTGLKPDDPVIVGLIDSVVRACHERSIPLGTAVNNATGAARAVEAGYSFVMVSNDTTIFARAVTALGSELQELRPG